MRGFESLFLREDGEALRPADAEPFEECVEPLAVLSHVDGIGRCSDDIDVVLCKRLGELDGGLSAERNDNADRVFLCNDVENVFRCQRLEIESVAGIEIGRDSLGVIVDDDDPVSQFAERVYAVNGSVVELDSLTDPDRAGADNDNGLCVAGIPDRGLVLAACRN